MQYYILPFMKNMKLVLANVSVTLTFCLFVLAFACSKGNAIVDDPKPNPPKQEDPKPDPKPMPIDVVDLIKTKTTLVKNVIFSETKILAEGISVTNLKYLSSSDKNMSIHVIIADFGYKHVTAQVLNPYNTDEERFQNLADMTKVNEEVGTKILAAVNGDYFSWSNMKTTGPFIYDGTVRKANTSGSTRPAFGITRTGLPVFLNAPSGQIAVFQYGDNLLRHLVGGNQWFIYNGNKITINDTTVEPRTAIGMRSDKKVIAVAVDGRQANHSNGMSFVQLQSLFDALDAKFAFNLDGGGSTVAVVRQNNVAAWNVLNSPSEIPLRAIANGIGFVVNVK